MPLTPRLQSQSASARWKSEILWACGAGSHFARLGLRPKPTKGILRGGGYDGRLIRDNIPSSHVKMARGLLFMLLLSVYSNSPLVVVWALGYVTGYYFAQVGIAYQFQVYCLLQSCFIFGFSIHTESDLSISNC